ncbi:MAG: glycosyltransferase family 39 protein [Planctomycetota bacterium]|nr:glycosyltransferase family 39 protein [Planctomycetota bacterium]
MKERRRPPWRWPSGTWVLLVLSAGLAWRVVRYTVGFPLWGDEAFLALSFFTRSWTGMLETLEYGMVAPVGFLWSGLAVTHVVGRSELALRLLPWLAGTGGFLIFWRLSRGVLGRHGALAALAILAASYYPVRHAAEVKPYSFDFLFSLPLYWAGWRTWCAPESRARWLALSLLMVVAVWFSYPSVFVSGGVSLALGGRVLARRQPREILAWIVGGLALSTSFVLMYWQVAANQQWGEARVGEGTYWGPDFPPLDDPWRLPGWLLHAHTGNMFAYPSGGRNYGSSFTTLLVVSGAVSVWRRGRKGLVLILLGALPLMLIAASLRLYPYGGSARIHQHLAGPICLLAGAGLAALACGLLPRRRSPAALRVAVALLLALIATLAVKDICLPRKTREDAQNRALVHELREETRPGDGWAAFGDPTDRDAPGGFARMRYYLELGSPAPLLWNPPPAAWRPPAPSGRLWMIAYRPPRKEAPGWFPEERWQEYRQALEARLGNPAEERRVIFGDGSEGERVEILRFDAAGR